MASNTTNLGLLKKNPVADGNDTFNVQTMLNENWDKIDEAIGNIKIPAQIMGLSADASISDVLSAAIPWIKIASYEIAGSYTWTVPDLFAGEVYEIGVFVIGAGGSGASREYFNNRDYHGYASGGASGFSNYAVVIATPGQIMNIVIGNGGESIIIKNAVNNGRHGNNGGSSSVVFGDISITANGGEGGRSTYSYNERGTPSTSYGGNSTTPIMPELALFGPNTVVLHGTAGSVDTEPFCSTTACVNVFENDKKILGNGGGTITTLSTNSYAGYPGGKDENGNGGGDGAVKNTNTNVTATDANLPGCGGGGVMSFNPNANLTLTSGAGADGAVYIYVKGPVIT